MLATADAAHLLQLPLRTTRDGVVNHPGTAVDSDGRVVPQLAVVAHGSILPDRIVAWGRLPPAADSPL